MGKDSKISEDEVEHIAWLARIELTKEEKKLFTKQFNTILEYFANITELNTDRILPTAHVLNLTNNFREDEVISSLTNKEALKNAPKRERGFFKAPKII